MTNSTRGVLIYAHDNDLIDYQKMATIAGALAKKNLGVPVAVVVDIPTDDLMDSGVFDYVIRVNKGEAESQFDYGTGRADYFNSARAYAFDHSPFEETLMIDADYMVHTDYLNHVWETVHPVALTDRVTRISKPMSGIGDRFLSMTGIPTKWATVTYFDKSDEAKDFFTLVQYIKSKWEYFSMIYGFDAHMYRNDIAYTIAAFMLNGNTNDGTYVADLLGPDLLFSWHADELMYVYDDGGYLFKCPQNEDLPVRLVNRDVHIMNKTSLANQLDKMYAMHVGVEE